MRGVYCCRHDALRPRPLRDDKVLTAWNGMMIGACARAASVLDEPAYRDAAIRAADLVLARLFDPQTGVLLRRWRDGEALHRAHLEDHMFLANGLLELHASTGDPEWIAKAITLAERALKIFGDPAGGGLFDTDGTDGTVLVRMKERHDGAEPSGNAIAASVFVRLAALTGGEKWRSAAEADLERLSAVARPSAVGAASHDSDPSGGSGEEFTARDRRSART